LKGASTQSNPPEKPPNKSNIGMGISRKNDFEEKGTVLGTKCPPIGGGAGIYRVTPRTPKLPQKTPPTPKKQHTNTTKNKPKTKPPPTPKYFTGTDMHRTVFGVQKEQSPIHGVGPCPETQIVVEGSSLHLLKIVRRGGNGVNRSTVTIKCRSCQKL